MGLCYHMVFTMISYALQGNAEDTSEKAFLILNEIILTVKSVSFIVREGSHALF